MSYSFSHTKGLVQVIMQLTRWISSNLISFLPHHDGSMYHTVFDVFFTSPCLLQHRSKNGFAGTGTLEKNKRLKTPLKEVKEMEKLQPGFFDVVLETKSKISVFCYKGNKVVTVSSTSDL